MSPANSSNPVFLKRIFQQHGFAQHPVISASNLHDGRQITLYEEFPHAGGINRIHTRKTDVFPCCVTIIVRKH